MWIYLIVGLILLTPQLNLDNFFVSLKFDSSNSINSSYNALNSENNKNDRFVDNKLNWSNYFLGDYFDYCFFTGLLLIFVAIFCFFLGRELNKNQQIQDNQIHILAKNYSDFKEGDFSNRESLNYTLIDYKNKTENLQNFSKFNTKSVINKDYTPTVRNSKFNRSSTINV